MFLINNKVSQLLPRGRIYNGEAKIHNADNLYRIDPGFRFSDEYRLCAGVCFIQEWIKPFLVNFQVYSCSFLIRLVQLAHHIFSLKAYSSMDQSIQKLPKTLWISRVDQTRPEGFVNPSYSYMEFFCYPLQHHQDSTSSKCWPPCDLAQLWIEG